jgi:hypothetical protein
MASNSPVPRVKTRSPCLLIAAACPLKRVTIAGTMRARKNQFDGEKKAPSAFDVIDSKWNSERNALAIGVDVCPFPVCNGFDRGTLRSERVRPMPASFGFGLGTGNGMIIEQGLRCT